MAWSCSIRLTAEDGRPLANYLILINFSGLIGSSHKKHTDSDGWAHFEDEYIADESSRAVDAVATYLGLANGTEVTLMEGGSIDDSEEMSFTIPDDEFADASDLP